MFSVVEGLKESKVKVFQLLDIDEQFYLKMKQFRDSTFHIGTKFFDRRIIGYLQIEKSADKTHQLHLQVLDRPAQPYTTKNLCLVDAPHMLELHPKK
jgi:hypothetical protein